jgi:DNA polymerase
MKARDLTRYVADLGWHDPLRLADPSPSIARAAAPTEGMSPPDCQDLEQLARLIGGCTRCGLARGRRNVVPGEGASRAEVLFIGEAPGAEEDRQGRPFVGQAGRLLDEIIFALGFERHAVWIGNVVKCRPPNNRDPQEEEMAACSGFLDRQIELIRPRVVVSLGRVAARRLTGTTKPMGAVRGRWMSYRGIPLIPLFHPAYLLRQPLEKRRVWEDLKRIRERLDEEPRT